MKKTFTKFLAALMLLAIFTPSFTAMGQTTVDVTLSSGSFNNNVITWTCADGNITIQQIKGSGSSNPSSSYISAPRVYKQNIMSFVATNGYAITNIDIKCNGAYYGGTMYAGTEISNNNVENNTAALNPTWTTSNGGTHTITTVSSNGLSEVYIQNSHSSDANNQLRITGITITYKITASVTATTVTINDSGITNTDVYTSTTAGTLSASVTETESGNAISGATVTWSSSNTDVATIDATGAVTLVAVGTTTITASYAGISGTYGSSSATYELTVTSTEPYVQPTTIEITPNYTFWGKTGQFSGDTFSELSGSQDNVTLDWTKGTGSTYANTTAMRFYKDNTLTFTAPTGYEIKSIVITFTATQADLSFSPDGYSLSGTTGTWSGSSATVTMSRPSTGSSYAQISKYVITIGTASSAVATTTTINVPANFNTDLHNGTNAGTLTATVTAEGSQVSGATVTWTSSDTSVATVGESTGVVTLGAVGTTTITASYAGVTDQYKPSAGTYELTVTDSYAPGTVNNPYTVAQARAAIDANAGITNVYATGIISQVDSYSSNTITYWISDDGTTTNQLEVYKGKNLNNTNFTAISDVEVGATVIIYGTLKKYNDIYEFNSGNYLTSYTAPQHAVEAPTFSPSAGTYTTAQTVSMNTTTSGATIYYTLDGTEPTNASTEYTTALNVSTTTTIKAVAYDGTNYSNVTTANYHFCSAEDPYTVTEALAFLDYPANNIYVTGVVSTAPTSISSGTLTYYISADGTETNELEVYKGKDLNNEAFTAVGDIQVGDIVTIYGNVKIYNSTTEFDQGNYLVSFERPTSNYTLSVGNPSNITFTVNYDEEVLTNGETGSIQNGTEVTFTINVATGYSLDAVTVKNANNQDVAYTENNGVYSFTMPASNTTINATASTATTCTYTLATSIESGKQYIIVGQANSKYYAMGNDKGNNRYAYEISLDGTTATASIANTGVHEFTISTITEGYYSIMDATTSGGYLYAASSGDNYLKTETTLDENNNGKWAITFAVDGYVGVVAQGNNTRKVMQFNNGSILFACYASASQHPVYLYQKVEEAEYTKTISEYSGNGGYYLIASPVSNAFQPSATLGFVDATPANYDLYYFDEAQEKEWINFKDDENHTNINPGFNIVSGKGYLYASKNGTTLQFQGTPYSGNGEVSLTYTTASAHAATRGWNLIGNPFDDAAALNLPYYRLNGEGSALSANAGTGNVAAMEGVFVYAYDEATSQAIAKAKFTKGGSKRSISLVNINVVNTRGNVADNAIIRFDEGSTMPKFTLRDDDTKVYIPMGDKDYAIVSSNGEGSMPVNFKAKEMGMYTISVETEGIDLSYLHLIDRLTGEDVNLLMDSKYSFIASNSDMESRFILSFDENGINANNETFAFQSGSDIIVNGEGELQIFDVMGRMVKNTVINGVEAITMPQGVYVCKLNGNVQKIVVR